MSATSDQRAMQVNPFTRRTLFKLAGGAGAALALGPALAACGKDEADQGPGADGKVTISVVGFKVTPEEKGTPLDKAYQQFLSDFQAKHSNIVIDSKETPPEFDTKIIVDLASGTAPDVWSQDASSLAPLVQRKLLLDMRELQKEVPALTTDRFFPAVLDINKQEDGSLYGLPNDFTPVVVYYNPKLFAAAKLEEPKDGWTWDQQLEYARALTKDGKGRSAGDAGFDGSDVKTWGYRASKYAYLWVYRVWQNGSDILSPDRTTAKGFLDSAATMEALQWYADLVLKHKVSPNPSTLDTLTQKSSFDAQFIKGRFGMFDSGHWELTGLSTAEGFSTDLLGVVGQPKKVDDSTVIYQSSFTVRYDLPDSKKKAVGTFIEAATAAGYQQTKAVTGIAIAANAEVAKKSASQDTKFAEYDPIYIAAAAKGRPPSGSKVAKYPSVENLLNDMMDRIMRKGDVEGEVRKTVTAVDRELQG
ncbi:sugar ABC transporter substrate-binding protein [Microlunatus panaciterrae]|uniref:Multiple sugar transport system substrate-binding protein n=1 Tax=Microlunatus panaciterrae TaxID=400768 RepID=A0ABS2RPK3_9ACTN|nr:extracellular solute-binding protein [Microlunatus panaciterrae]MBM7800663.1 multiple sugar transport system substrate-binding protein [Microlunatus panaciterrae]